MNMRDAIAAVENDHSLELVSYWTGWGEAVMRWDDLRGVVVKDVYGKVHEARFAAHERDWLPMGSVVIAGVDGWYEEDA